MPGRWTIRVKTLQAQSHSVTIDPTCSVPDLKQRVFSETGVRADRQRLIFQGKVLKNDRSVAAYAIRDGVTIHMVEAAAAAPRAEQQRADRPRAAAQQAEGSPTQVRIAMPHILMFGTNAPPDQMLTLLQRQLQASRAGPQDQRERARRLRPPSAHLQATNAPGSSQRLLSRLSQVRHGILSVEMAMRTPNSSMWGFSRDTEDLARELSDLARTLENCAQVLSSDALPGPSLPERPRAQRPSRLRDLMMQRLLSGVLGGRSGPSAGEGPGPGAAVTTSPRRQRSAHQADAPNPPRSTSSSTSSSAASGNSAVQLAPATPSSRGASSSRSRDEGRDDRPRKRRRL